MTAVWVDHEGNEELVPAFDRRVYYHPRISPDGTRVAISIAEGGTVDVWVHDLVRGSPERLTFEGMNFWPVWTPDGQSVVYSSQDRSSESGLFRRAANGTGEEERLTTAEDQTPEGFSPTGELIFSHDEDLYLLSPDVGSSPQPLLQEHFDEKLSAISPNGRWIAYTSDETDQNEVYVRPFPYVNDGKWKISTDGGEVPRWNALGDELYYRNNDAVIAVTINDDPEFAAGTPRVLFSIPSRSNPLSLPNYDVSSDGRFFVPRNFTRTDGTTQLVVC